MNINKQNRIRPYYHVYLKENGEVVYNHLDVKYTLDVLGITSKGKPKARKTFLLANTTINKTLRPCKEESVDFDNTQNLYIEGDNLEVLKLLQEQY